MTRRNYEPPPPSKGRRESIKNLTEVKLAILDEESLLPDDRVVIHLGSAMDDREHIDSLGCWCKPLVMTWQEFLDTRFDS